MRTGDRGVVETEVGAITVDLSKTEVKPDETVFVVIRPEGLVCSRERGEVSENVFEGTVKRALFLGNFVDGEIQIKGKTLLALLSPHQVFLPGERVYVHVPADRCQVTR